MISGLNTGGAECFLAALAPRLAARGVDQRVASLSGDGPIAGRLEASGIALDLLDLRGPLKAPTGLLRLATVLRRYSPHVIQGWMYHGDLAATLASIISHSSRSLLCWGVRCSNTDFGNYRRQLRFVVRACARLSGRADLVIANSHAGMSVHAAIGYAPREWAVIHNGIDGDCFRPNPEARNAVRMELGIPSERVVIMHVGRTDPQKDHSTFLSAVARVPDAQAVLIGLGTEAYSHPPNVVGLGRRDDMARLLAAGDIIVSTSAYGEGFSNAIAEGMSAGLVPITTDVGDARTIVGDCGPIVLARDPAAVAAAIGSLSGAGVGELRRLGTAARNRIQTHFSLDRAAESFLSAYGRL